MALETNELYKSNTRTDQLRLFPDDGGIRPKRFAAVSGGKTIPQGTPVTVDTTTGIWGVYNEGGANGTGLIKGFAQEEIVINDSGSDNTETLGNVFMLGTVHRDDVNTATIRALLLGSPTEANVDDALRAATMRYSGLKIEGLDGLL